MEENERSSFSRTFAKENSCEWCKRGDEPITEKGCGACLLGKKSHFKKLRKPNIANIAYTTNGGVEVRG